MKALDPKSEVVSQDRRFTVDWYGFMVQLAKAATPSVTTVAGLQSAETGARGFVTDATVTTFNSIVAGGGANKVPVVFDGTNWRIG